MNVQRKERKGFITFLVAILILAMISFCKGSYAIKPYQKVDFSTGMVTASVLNVRQGPSLGYKIISKVYKNEYIRIFAKIENWYVVQTSKDIVGVVYADYIKPIYPQKQENVSNEEKEEEKNEVEDTVVEKEEELITPQPEKEIDTSKNEAEYTSTLTKDEKEVFDLINQYRIENNLQELRIR